MVGPVAVEHVAHQPLPLMLIGMVLLALALADSMRQAKAAEPDP